MSNEYSLSQLGWHHFFQQQLTLDEWETFTIARVSEVDRSQLQVLSENTKHTLPVTHTMPPITVGDWVLFDGDERFQRLLERSSLFFRKAAGTKVSTQLIASNIDTVFIVSSLNLDFNLSRIERYLVLTNEVGVEPVVVLTKVDCCESPQDYVDQVKAANPCLQIETVNSLEANSVSKLLSWCGVGKTVVFLGSSGVGKSTLINTLLGGEIQHTQGIREDDDKGRHTTTSRSLHLLASGGVLLDTPGMRELQIADCEHGVEETFSEITNLASQCKFSDCSHQNEPGCAVRAAIEAGELDERRLVSYLKLMREQAFNTATLAEKRERDREFGRYVRSIMKSKHKNKL